MVTACKSFLSKANVQTYMMFSWEALLRERRFKTAKDVIVALEAETSAMNRE